MPIPPILPVHDGGLFEHVETLGKFLGPLVGAIVGLIVWAWRKLEKSINKLEDIVTRHTEADEDIHDQIFTNQRESDAKLHKLLGEHEVRHK